MTARAADPHASRLAEEVIDERHDPVLWGEGTGPLGDEALRAFGRRGFFRAQVFGAEATRALRDEAERLAARAETDRDDVIVEPGSEAIRSVFRVHRSSDVFREVARDARLADVARQILGSDVYIHQSRINYKPAFDGREFQWHSDFETWHMEDGMPRMRAVSASIALTDNDAANGPLLIIPGSHLRYVRCAGETPVEHYRRSLQKQEHGVPSREAIRELADEAGRIEACAAPAGSVTFFDCNGMHASPGSLSPWPRINLFLVFNSVENLLVRPFGGRDPRPAFLGEREPVPVGRL